MGGVSENLIRLRELIRNCVLCPRRCGVDRTAGQLGACQAGAQAVVASAGPHFGEEPVLVGPGGSGTIFLAGCNLRCLFCQNYDISHFCYGRTISPKKIAALAIRLAGRGCANINFVTPTHVAHAIAEAILIARAGGLEVPVVYNCGGYESVEVLRLLEGVVEIYMPDFKYADADAARKYSDAEDYPAVAQAALGEMYRQVGPLELDANGLASRGVLVRHLVMPNDPDSSGEVIKIVARTAPGCAINVMGQYRPAYRAAEFPELTSLPGSEQVHALRLLAEEAGLVRVDH